MSARPADHLLPDGSTDASTREVPAVELQRVSIDACWSRIGVRGDRSCAQLQHHFHCRNCPTYSSAARALLDVPVPADAAAEWTAHFARPVDATQSAQRSVIVFRIAGEWLALPTLCCLEVAALRPVHSLPHRRNPAVLGVTNIRGELRVCVSLATLLDLPGAPQRTEGARAIEARRFLVVELDGGAIVFPVDEVRGVHHFRPEELQDPPATVAKARFRFTNGVLPAKGGSIGIVDEQTLLATVARSLA